MVEKVDAYGMVVWCATMLGDLARADQVSAEGLAEIQPGQVPSSALHVVAWRTYVLTLLGRWDEALSLADRAYQLSRDLGPPSTGYALHGFMVAIDIARAREDQQLFDRYAEIFDEIATAQAEGTEYRHWEGYADRDPAGTTRAVEGFVLGGMLRLDRLERGLSRLVDENVRPSSSAISRISDYAQAHALGVLEPQAERALGVLSGDAEPLRQAIESFERIGAAPYAARARCELALITNDHREMEAGLAVLDRLGDLRQIGRFERLQVG
jgi:tetratricopeptide (TPR) repeat protein